jgi:hypothetical protein
MQAIQEKLPDAQSELSEAMQARLNRDREAVAVAMRDEQSAQRYARKLLHRLSQSLAFALLCEAASDAQASGNPLLGHSAWRYFEEIEPPAFGMEDDNARRGVLELLRDEAVQSAHVI